MKKTLFIVCFLGAFCTMNLSEARGELFESLPMSLPVVHDQEPPEIKVRIPEAGNKECDYAVTLQLLQSARERLQAGESADLELRMLQNMLNEEGRQMLERWKAQAQVGFAQLRVDFHVLISSLHDKSQQVVTSEVFSGVFDWLSKWVEVKKLEVQPEYEQVAHFANELKVSTLSNIITALEHVSHPKVQEWVKKAKSYVASEQAFEELQQYVVQQQVEV